MPVTHDASQRHVLARARIGWPTPGPRDRNAFSWGGEIPAAAQAEWKRSCISPPNQSSPIRRHASRPAAVVPISESLSVTLGISQRFTFLQKKVDFTQG